MVNAARASTASASAPPSARQFPIGRASIKNAHKSPENKALNFSNRSKIASVGGRFAPHNSPITIQKSVIATSHPHFPQFLIATQILNIELTRTQQTRKHFLVTTKFDFSAPAPRLKIHNRRSESFLFDTNKAHKIIIVMRAPMKTKEKQFSIRYKFASRDIGNVAPVTGTKNVPHFHRLRNAACLGVLGVLSCPAASGPNWFAWLGTGA
jgi:hypothetical protein